jgi:hypothetical protein
MEQFGEDLGPRIFHVMTLARISYMMRVVKLVFKENKQFDDAALQGFLKMMPKAADEAAQCIRTPVHACGAPLSQVCIVAPAVLFLTTLPQEFDANPFLWCPTTNFPLCSDFQELVSSEDSVAALSTSWSVRCMYHFWRCSGSVLMKTLMLRQGCVYPDRHRSIGDVLLLS